MRDPNRITTFLIELEDLWERYPDLRFGQLIALLTRKTRELGVTTDTFYIEDDVWMNIINSAINERGY